MAEQLTARDVEFLLVELSPTDQAVHAFWSTQVADMSPGGFIRAWCTLLVPAELPTPAIGELCTSCRLICRHQLPGLELPPVGE